MTACVILPLLLGNRVRTDLVACYPDLAVLRRATRAGDWSGVEAYFDALPPRADRSTAVQLVAYSAGSERFLQKAVDTHRDSALARTLLGSRFIVIGWKARTRAWASQVSQAQWRVFLDYLGRAERILADAVAIDPEDSAAWTERITTARGLSLDLDEARRRVRAVQVMATSSTPPGPAGPPPMRVLAVVGRSSTPGVWRLVAGALTVTRSAEPALVGAS
jgi:hypothetical protein